jgi:hypothetical protein
MAGKWKILKLRFEATHEETSGVAYATLPDIDFNDFNSWTDEQLGNLLRNIIRKKLPALPENQA